MKRIISLCLSIVFFVTCFSVMTAYAEEIRLIENLSDLSFEFDALDWDLDYFYNGESYNFNNYHTNIPNHMVYIEHEDMNQIMSFFTDETLENLSLDLSDENANFPNKKFPNGIFFIGKDGISNYNIFFDGKEVAYNLSLYPDGSLKNCVRYLGSFRYAEENTYNELKEYIENILVDALSGDGDAAEKPDEEDQPGTETEKKEFQNMVEVSDLQIIYEAKFDVPHWGDPFKWGICSYVRYPESKPVYICYFEVYESEKDNKIIASISEDYGKNNKISFTHERLVNFVGSDGKEYDSNYGIVADFILEISVNESYEVDKVVLNGKQKSEYANGSNTEVVTDIIDMDTYSQKGTIPSHMFSVNSIENKSEAVDKTEKDEDVVLKESDDKDEPIKEEAHEKEININEEPQKEETSKEDESKDSFAEEKNSKQKDELDFSEKLEALKKAGIVEGDPDGKIREGDPITRAEFCAVVSRAFDFAKEDAEIPFSDVLENHWAAGYISALKNRGIINGKGNQIFAPEDNIINQDAVKMLVASLGYVEQAEKSGGYPNGYLLVASELEITDSMTFSNTAEATRATVFEMLYNSLDLIEN